MKILVVSEGSIGEQILIDYLREKFCDDQLIIVSLETQFYAMLVNQYDVIFIPFVPSKKSPLGEFLKVLLLSKTNIISTEWFPLVKRTEQTYRVEDIYYFSKLGLKYISWTRETDYFFDGVINTSSYIRARNYFHDSIQSVCPESPNLNNVAFVIGLEEQFWSESLLRYKFSNGYKKSTHQNLVTKQRVLLECLERTLRHLYFEKNDLSIKIFVTSEKLRGFLLTKLKAYASKLEILLIGPKSLSELAKCGTIVLAEPLFGLEELNIARCLMNEDKWPAVVRNTVFINLESFETVIEHEVADYCDINRQLEPLRPIIYRLTRGTGSDVPTNFNFFQFARGFFLRLLLYSAKNRIKKLFGIWRLPLKLE